MANSLLDRVPNLPRAEDLDMRNFSRSFIGPQPLPGAMRPNMRDSVGAQPQPQAQPPRIDPRLDAANRAATAASDAAYNNSPEGRATQRAYYEDRARRAGIGSKHQPAAGTPTPQAAAPQAAEAPKRGGFRGFFNNAAQATGRAATGVAGLARTVVRGGIPFEFATHHRELAPGTLPPEIVAARDAEAARIAAGGEYRGPEIIPQGRFNDIVAKHNAPPTTQTTQATQPKAAGTQPTQAQAPVRDLDYERQLQALGQSFEARPGMARPDLGYGVHDRTTMTNEQVGDMNPQGRVTVTRGPNGTMEFSGNDVRGAVSYQDDQGKALAGGGLRGQGFGNFNIAPADSNVAMGPNGSYAYSNSPNLRDFSPGGNGITGRTEYADGQVPQIIQDARRSQAESSARAQQLGVNISGMAPWQANQYMDEVQQARNINASQQANAGSYEERLKQLNDPTSDISKAMRRITSDMPDEFRNKRKYMAQHMQQQNEAALRLAGDYLGETDRIRKDGTSRYGIDEVSRAAEMKDATDRRNADLQAMSNIYSSQISAAGDARKAAVEERNYLNTRNDKALERLDKVFETQATDPKTGQVDPSHLNRLRTGAQAFIGNAADQYEKSGQHAKAEQLRQQGVAALSDDPSLMRRYSAALQADKLGRERFIGHDYVGTDNPGAVTVKEVKGNTVYMSNGTSLPLSTMRYQNNGVLPHRFANLDWFSDPTDEYAAIDPNNQIWGKK